MSNQPSTWQQRIEGEWHGLPSIFDAAGNHVGYNKVYRASTFKDGQTLYTMNTRLHEATGPLAARLEVSDTFAFGVMDCDADRIYLGPDFIGAGHPYGALVDAHYYAPGWTADLRTMVHILPDGQTQCYSSLLYDGPTICSVFNGLYKVAFDYHTNPETKARIDAFCESERVNGRQPHILPQKKRGCWAGELAVYGADQKQLGVNTVRIEYTPINLLRAEMAIEMEGAASRKYRYVRHRNGPRHSFEGPDVYGNGMGYGRALYISQHFLGQALKLKGREFLIDEAFTLSVVWQWYQSDRMAHTMFGVLHWQEG
jgi:hypothetical protein